MKTKSIEQRFSRSLLFWLFISMLIIAGIAIIWGALASQKLINRQDETITRLTKDSTELSNQNVSLQDTIFEKEQTIDAMEEDLAISDSLTDVWRKRYSRECDVRKQEKAGLVKEYENNIASISGQLFTALQTIERQETALKAAEECYAELQDSFTKQAIDNALLSGELDKACVYLGSYQQTWLTYSQGRKAKSVSRLTVPHPIDIVRNKDGEAVEVEKVELNQKGKKKFEKR